MDREIERERETCISLSIQYPDLLPCVSTKTQQLVQKRTDSCFGLLTLNQIWKSIFTWCIWWIGRILAYCLEKPRHEEPWHGTHITYSKASFSAWYQYDTMWIEPLNPARIITDLANGSPPESFRAVQDEKWWNLDGRWEHQQACMYCTKMHWIYRYTPQFSPI